ADFQNMFLAMVPPQAGEDYNRPIIPSFHRPELVQYWQNNLPADLQGATLNAFSGTSPIPTRNFFRAAILRPMPWDHPNFSGSSPYLDKATIQQLIKNNNPMIGQPDELNEQTTAA